MSSALDSLDLPPSLQAVLDGLQKEATGIVSAILRQLVQAQSPLSLVRQDAYAGLAASLDSCLSDPARAAAVLPALARVWPELLASIAVGLRQAPTARAPPTLPGGGAAALAAGRGGASGMTSPTGAASYRAISPAELTSMVLVLELACLLAPAARLASLSAGLLPLLLAQLPGAPPALACACLDALLAMQLRHPAAFLTFADQQGVQQVCHLLRDKDTPEPVRGHAVQFLNLLLTQLVPELLPQDLVPPPSPAPSPAPGTSPHPVPPPTPASTTAGGNGGGRPPTDGQPEQQAAVLAGFEAAKDAVAATLGREARAMLLRRVGLSDVTAEQKLGQLANALTLFIESDA